MQLCVPASYIIIYIKTAKQCMMYYLLLRLLSCKCHLRIFCVAVCKGRVFAFRKGRRFGYRYERKICKFHLQYKRNSSTTTISTKIGNIPPSRVCLSRMVRRIQTSSTSSILDLFYQARRRRFFFLLFPFFLPTLFFHSIVSALRSKFISSPRLRPSSSQGTMSVQSSCRSRERERNGCRCRSALLCSSRFHNFRGTTRGHRDFYQLPTPHFGMRSTAFWNAQYHAVKQSYQAHTFCIIFDILHTVL